MVDISLHDTTNNPPKAEAGKSGTTTWLSIRHGDSEITIYGREDRADALRMLADVFNDAFAVEPEPAPTVTPPDDDVIYF